MDSMDALQVEKVNTLAKSLYANRLAASMDEAFEMAQSILNRPQVGEERTLQELAKEIPQVAQAVSPTSKAGEPRNALKVTETPLHPISEPAPASGTSSRERMDALRRVIAEEEERMTSLKKELNDLKAEAAQSGQTSAELNQEVEDLAASIERSAQDLKEVQAYVQEVGEVKEELKQVEEAQERQDEIKARAEELARENQEAE